jgi:AcrR family transcriptional regulator
MEQKKQSVRSKLGQCSRRSSSLDGGNEKTGEKLQRIKAAGAELFTSKGFDATTTLDIAERARVSLGVMFQCIQDKRDLLFQIYMDELEETRIRGFAKVKATMPLLEQLLVSETVMYRQLAKNIPLERIFFQELTFCPTSRHAQRLRESRSLMIERIEHLILAAERDGLIKCDDEPSFIARHMFLASQGAMRWWILGPKPNVAEGIEDLRRIYNLHLRALNPSPAAFGKAKHPLQEISSSGKFSMIDEPALAFRKTHTSSVGKPVDSQPMKLA